MRVELVYTPGCSTYRKALSFLETVIAEERLPVPIELTESTGSHPPFIKLEGETLAESANTCMDELQTLLSEKWTELTSKMLRQT